MLESKVETVLKSYPGVSVHPLKCEKGSGRLLGLGAGGNHLLGVAA